MRAMIAAFFLLSTIFSGVAAAENRPIAIGQALGSRLGESSQQRDGVATERWEIIGRAGQIVTIEMISDEFDSVLRLIASDGQIIATDDNNGVGLNARIVIKLPFDGRYYIDAAAIWQKRGGNYRLSVIEGETPAKVGKDKLAADLEYFDRCLQSATNQAWRSELHSGRLLPLLKLQRDKDALTTAENAVTLAKQAGDKYALAKAFFSIGSGFVLDEEFNAALPYFDQALALRREIKDRVGEAITLSALANAYQLLDVYEKARDYFQQALALQRELKNRSEERLLLFGLAESYRSLKQPQQAIPLYEQALAYSRQLDNRSGDGYVLLGLADCYRALKQFDTALPLYEQALKTSREIKDRTLEAIALAAIADGYRYLGDFEKAVPNYEQTLAIRRELKDRHGEAYTLYGLAECARGRGQLSPAITYYQQMLAICRENKDRRGESIGLSGLGAAYRAQSQPQQAVGAYEQALLILREIKDRRGEYAALIGIAAAYRVSEKYDRAIPYLEQALAMNAENPDYGSLEPVLTSLATISFALRQYGKAVTYSERASTIKHEAKDATGEAAAMLLLATSQRALGRTDQALAAYRKALTLFHELKDATAEYSCHYGLAEVFNQRNEWQEAQSNWEAALKVIEMNPGALPQSGPLPGIVAPSLVYQSYVDALATLQQFPSALTVAERARVHSYMVAILPASQPNLTPATAEQAPQIARRLDATIVEYMLTQKGLVTWIVKPEGQILGRREAINTERLDAVVTEWLARHESKNMRSEKLREAIGEVEAATPLRTESVQNPPAQLNESDLYQLFFPDAFAGALPSEQGARLLIIAPDKLGAISFAELKDGQGHYLIDRFTLLAAPSVSALVALIRRRASEEAGTGSLVLGGPTPPTFNGKLLPDLDGAKDELKTVADILKTKALVGAMATKTALREQCAGKQIVHLATYGFTEDRQPLSSFLAIAPETNEQGDVISNGLLTVGELRSWTFNVDLLVVSAFQAGFSPTTGEGLGVLGHSLALAGCSSALLTLWSVDAKPTALFMKTFYEKFKKTRDAASSFRQSMLETRKKFKDPAQWAGFVLIGDPAR